VIYRVFALERWVLWVLTLDPVPRPAGAVGRAEPLRHDALKAHLAGVAEDDRAVLVLQVLVELQADQGIPQ